MTTLPLSVYGIDDDYGTVGAGWLCPYCDQRHDWVWVEAGTEYECEDCGKVSISPYDCDVG